MSAYLEEPNFRHFLARTMPGALSGVAKSQARKIADLAFTKGSPLEKKDYLL